MQKVVTEFFDSAGHVKLSTDERAKYPWREMDVGDWFRVSNTRVVAGSLMALSSVTGKRLGRKYVARTLELVDGVFTEVKREK